MRARHRPSLPRLDPSLASQVVSTYLLPLFESSSQLLTDQSRSLTFGTTKRFSHPLDPIPGTVYGELKLSEQLGNELSRVKIELAETKAKLKESEQRKESAISDLTVLQESLLAAESHLKSLQVHSLADKRQLESTHLTESRLQMELKTLQDAYSLLEDSSKTVNSVLQEQYARNDKLKNRLTEQEHINSLLLMENDIVGERLKGLYFAIQQIADSHHSAQRFAAAFGTLTAATGTLTTYTEELRTSVAELTVERDLLRTDNLELVGLRGEMKGERDKMAKVAKERIGELVGTLQKTEEEREELRGKWEEAEKNFKDLTEEYEKMRQKAKQYRMRRKQFGEEEEKVCRNCQKVYVDSENYNWSCRRHPNEYSGDIYWCCGKSNRDAIGCKISKHESKEDEEEHEIANEGHKQTTLQCSVLSI